MKRRDRTRNRRLTAEERAQFLLERQALVGSLITQEGFEGSLVLKHIRGSQYLIQLPTGQQLFASHKKQKNDDGAIITGSGWSLWENRA